LIPLKHESRPIFKIGVGWKYKPLNNNAFHPWWIMHFLNSKSVTVVGTIMYRSLLKNFEKNQSTLTTPIVIPNPYKQLSNSILRSQI